MMKFSNDKKSFMFIYANDFAKVTCDKMEVDLRKELEATKSALKMQTARCRHLVAAFTRKLQEKEIELRASRDLRDRQLSRLLRALLILESRLKKEQKLIRRQLEEKDLIIEKQEREISEYKRLETNGKWAESNVADKEGERAKPEAEECSLKTGEERLDNHCKGILNPSPLFLQNMETRSDGDDDFEYKYTNDAKKGGNAFRDNPVLESVNQILLRDEEELLETAKPVTLNLNEKLVESERGDEAEWYETNGSAVAEERTISGAWCMNVVEPEEAKTKKDAKTAEKTSPIKSQRMEEKACLEMSKKNLTVVDLEEIDSRTVGSDRSVSPAKSTASYEEIIPVSKKSNDKPANNLQKPPALPPKPARLLKPHQILRQQNDSRQQQSVPEFPSVQPASQFGQENQVRVRPAASSNKSGQPKKSVLNQFSEKPIGNRQSGDPETNSARSMADGCGTKNRPKAPESSSKPKKNQIVGQAQVPMDVADCVPQFGKPKKSEEIVGNCGTIKIGTSVSSLITGLSRETIVTELSGEQVNHCPMADDSHVSQLVRQFEVLGSIERFDVGNRTSAENEADDMRKNFEEFKLDESYVEAEESGRREGEGAESEDAIGYYTSLTIVPPRPKEPGPPPEPEMEYKMYETFLETTGLSQKSILTPSRMLSNHRSCLKPKDVKHRNRIKAAAAIEKCNLNTSNGGSTVKYWTEPFL